MTTLNTIIEEESTPDTEWKEKVRDWWYSIQDLLADKDICLHERKRVEIEQIIKEAITSRDTYWQERVREEVEEYKQFVLNVLDGVDIADGYCNTKAIRFALGSRTITNEDNLK